MTALFQANDILICRDPVAIYAILQARAAVVEIMLLYPRLDEQPEIYYVPPHILQVARRSFVHLNAAGELKSSVYPGLVKLGWNPDEGKSAIGWAIARIEHLEAMLKNA